MFRKILAGYGLVISGITSDDTLVEAIEWPEHSWGIGVQFHPEFRSKPVQPHPLFSSFVKASIEYGKR
jgi:CTP synthase